MIEGRRWKMNIERLNIRKRGNRFCGEEKDKKMEK